MKTIAELRYLDLKLSSSDLFFSNIKDLHKRKIDMDVYLPSKQMNLQREHVWTVYQKRELIMSIFMARPIPPICVLSLIDPNDIEGSDIKQIIDGKQRLTAMMDFYYNKFTVIVEDVEYYYDELPNDYKKEVANYSIKCQTAYDGVDEPISDKVKIEWFYMINFSGTPQDLAHMDKLKQARK